MKSDKKLCLICSVGGHLTQMQQLSELYSKYEYFLITEKTPMTIDLEVKERVYLMPLINRRQWNFIFKFLFNLIYSLIILLKEKPNVVISTGALNSVPCCLLAKMLGIKLIFIESFAKVTTPTITGRLLYRFANLFIIQWPQLQEYYPKAINGGSIY